MPRLVNVRAVCDRCESAEAVSYCENEKENQCQSCDGRVHFGMGGLIGHMRRPLDPSVTVLAVCQRCGEPPAWMFCDSLCGVICASCDADLKNSASEHFHNHSKLSNTLSKRPVKFHRKISDSEGGEFSLSLERLNSQNGDETSTKSQLTNIPMTADKTTKAKVEVEILAATNPTPQEAKRRTGEGQQGTEVRSWPQSVVDQRENNVEKNTTDDGTPKGEAEGGEEISILEKFWPSGDVFFQDPEDTIE
ncbi:hypothetical protein NDN08_000583 [Rhodosorus marinus]|uniref:B box-type domain-containing protein n=1 Tax=Rhodosorus marinus TaxID=101924 RepID=A0AAV8UNJ0_9RHOD|nr:hypothetical protein NDN08_000583 [Rhodosorus marinus]